MASARYHRKPPARDRGVERVRVNDELVPPIRLERSRLRDADYIAELLGIPRKTVLHYARDGRLPCVRLGKHVRFVIDDVERAIESQRSTDQDR